jgi:hypothetical protein
VEPVVRSALSWLIVVAVGLAPMLVCFPAGVIGRGVRRKLREHRPDSTSVGTEEDACPARTVEAPPQ